jgi:hypothetical protein
LEEDAPVEPHSRTRQKRHLPKIGSALELLNKRTLPKNQMSDKGDNDLRVTLWAWDLFSCIRQYFKEKYAPTPQKKFTAGILYQKPVQNLMIFIFLRFLIRFFPSE